MTRHCSASCGPRCAGRRRGWVLSGSSPDTVSARAGLHRGTAESRDGSGQSEVDRPLVGPGRERCSGGRYGRDRPDMGATAERIGEQRRGRGDREHIHDQHQRPGRSGLGNVKSSVMSDVGSARARGPTSGSAVSWLAGVDVSGRRAQVSSSASQRSARRPGMKRYSPPRLTTNWGSSVRRRRIGC